MARQGRAAPGHGTAGHGRTGQGRARQGRAGQGPARRGREAGPAGTGRQAHPDRLFFVVLACGDVIGRCCSTLVLFLPPRARALFCLFIIPMVLSLPWFRDVQELAAWVMFLFFCDDIFVAGLPLMSPHVL